MPEAIVLGKIGELEPGRMKAVSVSGREIMLARVGDRYYAADKRCPHMGGNLSLGRLEGTIVTCPRHGSQFDLTDGRVVRWTTFTGLALAIGKLIRPPRPLRTYPVTVKGGDIVAEI